MTASTPECPRGHTGEAFHVRKDGLATTKDGRRQMYRCIAADGSAHRFYGPTADEPRPDRRRTAHDVRCPQPGHKDGVVQSRGIRKTGTGTWRRFVCRRPDGTEHTFKLMLDEDASVVSVRRTPPPPCPEHPGSKVVRDGTYGKRSTRQRYVCRPEGGREHQFTPPLSREAVAPGTSCSRCDELLSPHHGSVLAARHTPWPLTAIAHALNDLSLGESYASVSLALRARRDAAREHLHHDHGIDSFPGGAPAAAKVSSTVKERRNAWRVAADLVEQYGPPLFEQVDSRYKAEARAKRERNDVALAGDPGASLTQPLVYVLDELPIFGRTTRGGPSRPQWYVLTAVEVLWRPTSDPDALPERGSRLRLARAFPRGNGDAWRLVLDELEVRPDFVVADRGTGIQAALANHYGNSVGVVPSLWHIHTNLRDGLLKLDNTWFADGKEKVLVDPLRKHLSRLGRDDLLGWGPADVLDWFDELEAIVAGLPAPISSVRAQRGIHEPRLLAALPILAANPHVPASNAAVENRIRMALKPFLENRSHMFGNAERTNRLLNLLVCREAGTFTNLDDVALNIRQMNEATGGWAPAPRQILDKQPATSVSRSQRYESLKSHSVISKLAKSKGIPTTAQTAAQAPMPLLSKKRAQTVQLAPVREWARSMGLPGNPTGPVRASVKKAYQARQEGATDEEAVVIYEEAEKARFAKNNAKRDANWTSAAEAARTKELAPVRRWAKENGIALSSKGIIPAHIMKAYKEAQRGESEQRRPSKRPKRSGA